MKKLVSAMAIALAFVGCASAAASNYQIIEEIGGNVRYLVIGMPTPLEAEQVNAMRGMCEVDLERQLPENFVFNDELRAKAAVALAACVKEKIYSAQVMHGILKNVSVAQ